MAYKVLIVDDSAFFRRRIKQILEEDTELEVVGEAKNGQEALSSVVSLRPDVVTMDIEMPVMDGITAVKKIMANNAVPIIMFSSLTQEGAQATLDALDAGALDFIPKKFEDIALNRKEAVKLLQTRVKSLARGKPINARRSAGSLSARPIREQATSLNIETSPSSAAKTASQIVSRRSVANYACLAIGTSTGGPVALQKILTELPANFSVPVIIVQHMPGSFTQAFAKRLNELCQLSVKEAEHRELLRPGVCYLAPGGKHMTLEGSRNSVKVNISEPSAFPSAAYKPSVDVTFDSIAGVYSGDVLAVILTGMGADGREGCKTLKARGAKIWAQDEQSCVVYGMPQAVTVANISEVNYDIEHMAGNIKNEILG